MKTSSFSALLLVVAASILSACQSEGQSNRKNDTAKEVVVYKVTPQPLQLSVEAIGTAMANESIAITAKVPGRLEKVFFSDGQPVKKGDVIARLDQDEEQARLMTAKVQLAEHQREIKRLKTLLARHAAPVRDLDERKTLAAVTASSIKEIQARLDELTLKAPFDGKLGIRHVSPGALIQPGTVLTTLDQTNPIKLDFTIPATRLQGINPGTKVEAFSDAVAGRVFTGEVTALDSRINPVTRTMLIRAELDNSDYTLIPGMLMRVKLQQAARQALLVPEESITQKQERHFITIIGTDQTAELRAITIGQRLFGTVEVAAGLAEGELVVVRGMEFIRPGGKVHISETWDAIKNTQFPGKQQTEQQTNPPLQPVK